MFTSLLYLRVNSDNKRLYLETLLNLLPANSIASRSTSNVFGHGAVFAFVLIILEDL